jgi:hypothetical protein
VIPKLDVAGFDPGLPLQEIKHLAPLIATCTPLYSIYITKSPVGRRKEFLDQWNDVLVDVEGMPQLAGYNLWQGGPPGIGRIPVVSFSISAVPIGAESRSGHYEVVLVGWTKKRQSLDRAAGC